MLDKILLMFTSVDGLVADISRKVRRLRQLQLKQLQVAGAIDETADKLRDQAHTIRNEAARASVIAAKLEALVN